MSELRKAKGGHAFFMTFTAVGWIDVFTRKDYCDIAIDSLRFCQEHKSLEIYAYVIMPSHIHMVARRMVGEMSDLIRDFKSFTAKAILSAVETSPIESRKDWLMHMFRFYARYETQNKELMFWQKTSHPIELFSNHMIDQKINYIHQNPVTAGICTDETSFVYSSANPEGPLYTVEA